MPALTPKSHWECWGWWGSAFPQCDPLTEKPSSGGHIDKSTPEKSQFNTFTTPLKNVDILISYALKDFPQASQGFTHSPKSKIQLGTWPGPKAWIIHGVVTAKTPRPCSWRKIKCQRAHMAPSFFGFVAFVFSHKQAVGVSYHLQGRRYRGII